MRTDDEILAEIRHIENIKGDWFGTRRVLFFDTFLLIRLGFFVTQRRICLFGYTDPRLSSM